MANRRSRQVLNVFIASPSDLIEERRAARAVVDEVNEIFGRGTNWHVELIGWEDTLPGFGRPQSIINQDVDSCDLFVGLLWCRWGSPTGEYESGFEEEFKRAKLRRQGAGLPEIWMFFKDIDPVRLTDAGPQLGRVVLFKEEIKDGKEILYHEFSVLEEWKGKFRACLMRYILQLNNSSQQYAETLPAEASQPQSSAGTSPAEGEDLGGEGNEQAIEVMGIIARAMAQRESSSSILSPFQTARLFLIASSFMEQYSQALLGTHEINLLYKNKEQLKTTPSERILLFRTMMQDIYDVIPGWFFFQESLLSDEELTRMVFETALHDGNSSIRANVWTLLGGASIAPPEEEAYRMLLMVLREADGSARKAGVSYFKSVASLDQVILIEQYLNENEPDLLPDVKQIEAILVARKDPETALAAVLRGNTEITEEFKGEVRKQISTISVALLKEAALHTDHWIRLLAIEELLRRQILTNKEITDFITDPSLAVKTAVFRELIRRGVEYDPEQIQNAYKPEPSSAKALGLLVASLDADDLILEIFRHYPAERLLQLIDWYSTNGRIAYRALVQEHFKEMTSEIRSDLNGNFERIKKEATENLERTFGDRGHSIAESFNDLNDFIRGKFVRAALEVISEQGEAEDITFGRKFLFDSDTMIQRFAIRLLDKHGNPTDVESLVKLVLQSSGEIKVAAAATALKLTPGVNGVATDFLKTEDPVLVALTLTSIGLLPEEEALKTVEFLLSSEKAETRLKAVAYCAGSCSPALLKQFLEKYLQRDSYYYNVVCWFDRILYAPLPKLKQFYMSRLAEKLGRD